MTPKRIVYIDTDIALGTPGAEIDDAAALMLLLASPGIQIAGIGSVFGNTSVANVTANLARFLNYFNRDDIPLGHGAENPLAGNLDWFKEWQSGYGQTPPYTGKLPEVSACDLLIDTLHQFPNQLSILALGPMTNLAQALQKSSQIIQLVREVIAMGGSFDEHPSSPEFNIHCDPVAADRVIHAGWPVTLFGLNITRQASFTSRQFAALSSCHPALDLLKRQASFWIERVTAMGWDTNGCALHDAVAAAYFLDDTLFKAMPAKVNVNTKPGKSWGTTQIQENKAENNNIKVVKEVDAERCRDLIWSSISKIWEA